LGVLRGLDAVAALSEVMKVPDPLRDRLCAEDGIDRDELSTVIERLGSALDDLERLRDHVSSRLAINQIGSPSVPFVDALLDDVKEFVRQAEDFVGMRIQALDTLTAVLRDDADVSLEAVSHHAAIARRLVDLQAMLHSVREQLGVFAIDPGHELDAGTIEAAEWIVSTSELHGGNVPHPM
jgi:hypothetical protein